ncbi:MAG TPA: carbohydrate-binding protein, partial [Ktedonobacteraceae bacterium]|nr:carbohydrate-binding protein [Ktedonobacteraceae bacterium]
TLNTAVLFIGHAAVSAFFVNGFAFEHNVIQNTPYNGLSMGWGWHNFNGASDSVFPGNPTTVAGNNTVSYNAFFNMVQTLTDTGAIYTLGAQPNTSMTNNYIDGIPNHGLSEGIHLDEGSAYMTITNSVINVASGTLAYSGNNCCEQHDLTITNTYATTGSIWTPIASNSREDAPMVYANANWPAAALSIIQSAGLEAAYQNVSPLYTADHASLAGGACLASDHAGYIGSGFAACFTAQGASATFTVNVDASGTYTVLQRYANGPNPAAEAKTVSVYVNGSKVGQVSFPATGDWNTWANQSLALTLQAGANTITYKVDAGDIGWLNFDALSLLEILGSNHPTSTLTPTPTTSPTSTPTQAP